MSNKRFGGKQLCVALFALATCASAHAAVLKVVFNSVEIGIDDSTGSVVYLNSPGTGPILQASPESAGVLDLAYPVDSFAAMRLSSRFSKAEIAHNAKQVTITWKQLGASHPNLALPAGAVHAKVTVRAADDGKSVIWQARIENASAVSVPQVLFPDLWGLKPVEGAENTRLRLARGTILPFAGAVGGSPEDPFFTALDWKKYPAGNYYEQNALRWIDYGGFQGGLSIFQKKWGTLDWPDVITHRTERDPMSLRMAWEHKQEIKPGQSWDSGEFWFTPHAGGWAKGIEVYRDYVRQVNPPRPLPARVREDIGFQTIWMIQTVDVEPAQATFRYQDLPRVAADARRYGIHEVVPWGWSAYSELPIPIRPELGTLEDLLQGVQQSRELGVSIAPFISVLTVRNKFAAHYGVAPSNDDWTYHRELVPMFRPYYTKFWNGVAIDSDNEVWQKEVVGALDQWIRRGITSFSWDQFRVHQGKNNRPPGMLATAAKIRALARAADPQSSFSGESSTHLEFESQALDYLWNWRAYEDAAPITNVLSSPRVSCNVEKSALVVAKCFADNLYINAMPRKPDQANGTALISDVPELATALTQAASLRKQFLPYFTGGTFIGDSVASRAPSAFVRGYQLDGKMLVIVLNDQERPRAINVQSDLGLWIRKAAAYGVTAYDGAGKKLGSSTVSDPRWFGATPELAPGAMAFFEIAAK